MSCTPLTGSGLGNSWPSTAASRAAFTPIVPQRTSSAQPGFPAPHAPPTSKKASAAPGRSTGSQLRRIPMVQFRPSRKKFHLGLRDSVFFDAHFLTLPGGLTIAGKIVALPQHKIVPIQPVIGLYVNLHIFIIRHKRITAIITAMAYGAPTRKFGSARLGR